MSLFNKFFLYKFKNYSIFKTNIKFLFCRNTILVYSMPKTGSMSVFKTLQSLKITEMTFHTHFLSNDDIKQHQENIQRDIQKGINDSGSAKPLDKIMFIRSLVETNKNKRWKIITLVRDPIQRNLSEFFYSLPKLKFDLDFKLKLTTERFQLLKKLFLQKQNYYYELISTWFDRQIKRVFGIDVYDYSFPTENGYTIIKGKRAEILIIRLEDLNRCYKDAFGEFFKIDDCVLINDNLAKEKIYASLYDKFQKRINFSEKFIEKMYSAGYTKHFYSEREINRFKEKWIN